MIILRKINPEQREFGKITKFLPKSIAKNIDSRTRPIKYKKGVKRRNKAIELENELKRRNLSNSKPEKINEGPDNPGILKKLDELASREYKTEVVFPHNPDIRNDATTIINTKGKSGKLAKEETRAKIENGDKRKFTLNYNEALNNPKNKSVIAVSVDTRAAGEAHELGHVHNRRKGSIMEKIISNLDNPSRRSRFHRNVDVTEKSNAFTRFRDKVDSAIILKEEKNASKNALETLKKEGMSQEELEKAKKALDESYETYKNTANNRNLANKRYKIQIPSRRNIPFDDPRFGDKSRLR